MTTPWQINDYIPDPNTGKDRWQIYKILKGGMGVVYIVYDTEWREVFAVKTYQDSLQSEYAKEQFKKEAHVWINLDRHENIAWARHIFNIQNRLYLFLEYVAGGDLSCWIGTKRLDLKQILLFTLQFCYGMEHALAKGIKAHRDIKPRNCLVTEDGTLKITDFGLAKAWDTAESEQALDKSDDNRLLGITSTRTGQAGGTLAYMAPEQFNDLKRVDIKADIYSFGIMLYEMICGHQPFTGSNFSEFREKHQKAQIPAIPPFSVTQAVVLSNIVRKCLAKQPCERYVDFSQLRSELTQLYEAIYAEQAPIPKEEKKLSAMDFSNKGSSLVYLEHYRDAIVCYDKALELDPLYAQAWTNKGAALGNLNLFEEAIICCDQAIAINPKHADAWYNKGTTLVESGRYEEAIPYFDRVLEIDPKYTKALCNKGRALGELDLHEESLKYFDNAIEIDPKDGNAWYNKGVALKKLRRYNDAIFCYDRAVEIDPNNKNAWTNKGAALEKLEQYEDAIACYNKALEFDQRFVIALFNKGVALGKLERNEEAVSCYERVLEIDPRYANAWSNRGVALAKLERLDKALASFREAQQLGLPQGAEGFELCQKLIGERGDSFI